MNTIQQSGLLASFISDVYDLPQPVECQFARRGFNDHYSVKSGGERYFLRIYLNGKYYISGRNDFRFELELLRFLSSSGVPVVRPIANKSGQLLSTIKVPEGERHMGLFEFAEGEPIEITTVEGKAEELGETVATIHVTADAFRTENPRYHMDLHYLIDEPLRLIESHLLDRDMGDLRFFSTVADDIRNKVGSLAKKKSVYGIIHGDLIPKNIFYSESSGLTFMDFDYGGYGWRAYDLETLLSRYSNPVRRRIQQGYENVRPLSDLETNLMPIFKILRRDLWDIGDILAMLPAWGKPPDDADDEYLQRALHKLQNLASSWPVRTP